METPEERLMKFLADLKETAERLDEWVLAEGSLLAASNMPRESVEVCETATREYALKVRELYREAEYLLIDD